MTTPIAFGDVRAAIHGRDRSKLREIATFALFSQRPSPDHDEGEDEPLLDYLIALSTPRWVDQWVTEYAHQRLGLRVLPPTSAARLAAINGAAAIRCAHGGWFDEPDEVADPPDEAVVSRLDNFLYARTRATRAGWPTLERGSAPWVTQPIGRFDFWAREQGHDFSRDMAHRLHAYDLLAAQGFRHVPELLAELLAV